MKTVKIGDKKMRTLKEIVKDFLKTDFARKDCDADEICDLIAEMDEHFGNEGLGNN